MKNSHISIILASMEDNFSFKEIKKIILNCGVNDKRINQLFQESTSSGKPLISKNTLISNIITVINECDEKCQNIVIYCLLIKLSKYEKFDFSLLKDDLLLFGYQVIENESQVFIISKKLFDVDYLKYYDKSIHNIFLSAISTIENNDYKSAITKFIKVLEIWSFSVTSENNEKHSLEQKLYNALTYLEKLKNSEKDTTLNIEKFVKNISVILSRYRTGGSDVHINKFEVSLKDVLIVKTLVEFILVLKLKDEK